MHEMSSMSGGGCTEMSWNGRVVLGVVIDWELFTEEDPGTVCDKEHVSVCV